MLTCFRAQHSPGREGIVGRLPRLRDCPNSLRKREHPSRRYSHGRHSSYTRKTAPCSLPDRPKPDLSAAYCWLVLLSGHRDPVRSSLPPTLRAKRATRQKPTTFDLDFSSRRPPISAV